MDKKVWNVIKHGKIIKVTFPGHQPQPVKEERELDWFRLYQPEGANVETDIAVIERQVEEGQWEILCYIGPDRTDGEIEHNFLWESLRIRYLNNENKN